MLRNSYKGDRRAGSQTRDSEARQRLKTAERQTEVVEFPEPRARVPRHELVSQQTGPARAKSKGKFCPCWRSHSKQRAALCAPSSCTSTPHPPVPPATSHQLLEMPESQKPTEESVGISLWAGLNPTAMESREGDGE